jgi:Ni,Fe-hydrogenase III small subunit/formate hydrogenlyase subunit 6/NADH:ubiquinone oxidoreductase subunit I
MLKTLMNRFEQGYRTSSYPKTPIDLPARYRGLPKIDPDAPEDLAKSCANACPQAAFDGEKRSIDLGRCCFCGTCERVSEGKLVQFTQRFELSTAKREHLITPGAGAKSGDLPDLANHAKQHFKKLFGRSLQLRQISAAGCNACEADLNVLATPFFDLSRFGIDFVASPRHADAIVVTGPISRNMRTATLTTYEAMPAPKAVIAVGACAISGGPFTGSPEISEGLESLLPVDLFIPGCPSHPLTNLHALLSFFK